MCAIPLGKNMVSFLQQNWGGKRQFEATRNTAGLSLQHLFAQDVFSECALDVSQNPMISEGWWGSIAPKYPSFWAQISSITSHIWVPKTIRHSCGWTTHAVHTTFLQTRLPNPMLMKHPPPPHVRHRISDVCNFKLPFLLPPKQVKHSAIHLGNSFKLPKRAKYLN